MCEHVCRGWSSQSADIRADRWRVGVDKVLAGIDAVYIKEVKIIAQSERLECREMGLIDRKDGVEVKFRTARKWRGESSSTLLGSSPRKQ